MGQRSNNSQTLNEPITDTDLPPKAVARVKEARRHQLLVQWLIDAGKFWIRRSSHGGNWLAEISNIVAAVTGRQS